VPADTVKNEVRAGTLIAITLGDGALTRPVGVIHRKRRALSAPARAFVELLQREMAGSS
jgi:DNA-binding transcriptional LysR family regulator